MLDPDVERFISQRVGIDISGIQLQVGVPSFRLTQEMSASVVYPGALQQVGSSLPNLIIISPEAFEPGTASGIALLAHEYFHQAQFQTIPDFMSLYQTEAARVEREGLKPYENIFEWPAYELEAQVYVEALAQGYPAGSWKPLLVQEGIDEQPSVFVDDPRFPGFQVAFLMIGALSLLRVARR